MGKKREDEKSSGYHRGFRSKSAPTQDFYSNVAELKGAVFTLNPNQAGAAKFEKSIEIIGNYVVRNYDGGIILAKGIREGKLPVVSLPEAPTGTRRKKKKNKKKKKKKKKRKKKKKKKKKQKKREAKKAKDKEKKSKELSQKPKVEVKEEEPASSVPKSATSAQIVS